MKSWLKAFHSAIKKNRDYDKKITLFLGAAFIGILIGANQLPDMPPLFQIIIAALGVWNFYLGLFMGTASSEDKE